MEHGLIKLIDKGNDIYENYRGMTLNSCLGELFCTDLYNRLTPIFEQERIYCKGPGYDNTQYKVKFYTRALQISKNVPNQ